MHLSVAAHVRDVRTANDRPQLWLCAVLPADRRSDHEPAHGLRMANRDLQSDARAVAEAEDVGLPDLQLPQQRRDVVCRSLEPDGRVAIARPTVSLLFDSDDT